MGLSSGYSLGLREALNPESERRLILLCVADMTPQVITETLYALTQLRGERVDEIRVITTRRGRDCVLARFLDAGRGEFFNFYRSTLPLSNLMRPPPQC